MLNKDIVSPPYEVSPESFGLKEYKTSEIKGGSPEGNATVMHSILDGEEGPFRNVVVMNTAAAIVAGDLTEDLKDGARLAEESIDSGQAKEKLNLLVELSQRLG